MVDTKHIHSEYDKALDSLRSDFAVMFDLVEMMLEGSCSALLRRDSDLARDARMTDKKVDALDSHISETIIEILVRWQPLANDLRFILACSRSVGHLERIGDYMKNICKRVRDIAESGYSVPEFADERLEFMFGHALLMLRLTRKAFLSQDASDCMHILSMDMTLDSKHKETFDLLRSRIVESPLDVFVSLELMLISKNLERSGDHITNIAEMVAFSVAAETYTSRQLI